MRAALAAVACLVGLSVPAAAAPIWSAADLREACADDDLYYLYGACTGYLLAVHDGLGEEAGVCLPAEDANLFALALAADAVGSQPEVAGETATALAGRALAEAFPC